MHRQYGGPGSKPPSETTLDANFFKPLPKSRRLGTGTKFSEVADRPIEFEWFASEAVDYGDEPMTPTDTAPSETKPQERQVPTTAARDNRFGKALSRFFTKALWVGKVILFLALLIVIGGAIGVGGVAYFCELGR